MDEESPREGSLRQGIENRNSCKVREIRICVTNFRDIYTQFRIAQFRSHPIFNTAAPNRRRYERSFLSLQERPLEEDGKQEGTPTVPRTT
jgi:hypothetical protein